MTSESQLRVIDIDQQARSISGELVMSPSAEEQPYQPFQPEVQPTGKKRVSFHKNSKNKFLIFLRQNLLTILTILGVLGGVTLGLCLRLRESRWKQREVMYVKFLGELFLQMLRGLTLPLLVSSLIAAIGGLDLKLSRKIGGRAIVYYLGTTAAAVLLGIVLALAIGPGIGATPVSSDSYFQEPDRYKRTVIAQDAIMDIIRNFFPPNLIQATMETYETSVIKPENWSSTDDQTEWKITGEFVDFPNSLGIIIFSVVLGIALGRLGERGRPLLNVFISLSNAMMMITEWVAWIGPVGVCFLIASELINTVDPGVVFSQLGKYLGTVLAGLFIHAIVVLPSIYTFFTWRLPFRFFGKALAAVFNAFGTASSYATLSVAITSLEEKNEIDPRVTRFLLPIGATVNMDGTAMYQAVAVLWIAEMKEIPLGFGTIISIFIASILASIGTAGVPQGGYVMMMMVLFSVGLDPGLATNVLPLEWIIDRFCTSINVLSDIVGAGVVYHMTRNEMEEMDRLYSNVEAAASDDDKTLKSGSMESLDGQQSGGSTGTHLDGSNNV